MKLLLILFLIFPFLTAQKSTQTLLLPNDLKVLLISDPTRFQSSVCIQVPVGSSYDPPHISGIAHLLEHMLHMRSKKYPIEDFYRNILALFKGTSNAMTSDITTTYYFITNDERFEDFEKISDIFSRFFIDPILEKENVEREINAVNNEYEMDLVSNDYRFQELMRDLSNENSTFRHFSVGNQEKLDHKKKDITKELQLFFDKYYSSHNMNLVIYSYHPIEDLKKIASIFAEIPNKKNHWTYPKHLNFLGEKTAKTPIKYMPFPKKLRNRLVSYESIGNLNTLAVIFPLQNNLVKINGKVSKPVDFLINLLRYKGKKGLFETLKRKDLITDYSVSHLKEFVNLNLLIVKFELKTQDFKKKLEVLKGFFSFIRKLRGVRIGIYKKLAFRQYLEETYIKDKGFQEELFDYMNIFKEFGDFNIKIQRNAKNFLQYKSKVFKKYVKFMEKPENSLLIFTEKMNKKAGFARLARFLGTKIEEKRGNLGDFDLESLFELKEAILPEKKILTTTSQSLNLRLKASKVSFEPRKGSFFDTTMKFYFKSSKNPKKLLETIRPIVKSKTFSISQAYFPTNFSMISQCPSISLQKYGIDLLNSDDFYVEIDRKEFFNKLFYGKQWTFDLKPHKVLNKTCWLAEKYSDFYDLVKPLVFNEKVKLWFLTDRIMEIPKIAAIFEISLKKETSRVFLMVFILLFEEKFSGDINEIRENWGNLNINAKRNKVFLRFFGYSDKFQAVVRKIFELLKKMSFGIEEFEKSKEIIGEKLDLMMKDSKMNLLSLYFRRLFMRNAELPFEVKEMLNQIEFKDFEGFIEEFKTGFRVKGLIIGNIIESDIRKLGSFLKKSLPKPEKALKTNSPKRKHINFTNKSLEYFELSDNKKDKNSGILNIYVKKGYSPWDMRLLKALVDIFHNRAFYYLRTKKQLGYKVFSKIYSNKDFAGLGILIQGSRHNPLEMDQEIENFIRSFKKYIHNPKNRSLFENKKKKDKKQTKTLFFRDYSLNDRAENLWRIGLSHEKKKKSRKD